MLLGDEGIIVEINKGINNEDHGTVAVWRLNETEYGANNCEHYAEFELEKSTFQGKEILKILKKAGE